MSRMPQSGDLPAMRPLRLAAVAVPLFAPAIAAASPFFLNQFTAPGANPPTRILALASPNPGSGRAQ